MLHHISVGVSEIARSARFYDETLGALGYIRVWEDLRPGELHQAVGYGLEEGNDKFTIKERFSKHLAPGQGFHLAFAAPSQEAVEQWHQLGLANGGESRGAPRVWDEFGPKYFAAYLIDPDGWQLEAVFKLA